MIKNKLEIVFAKQSDEPVGFTVLGSFDMGCDVDAARFPMPSIGEWIVVNHPDKDFVGQVIRKCIMYSQKDLEGKAWDWVTRIILILELDPPATGADLASLYPVQPIRPN